MTTFLPPLPDGVGDPDSFVSETTSDFHEQDHQRETFVVDDDGKADWAMRKYAGAQRRIDAVGARRTAEADRLADWYEEVTRADQQTVNTMKGLLSEYAVQVRADTGEKQKSVSTPHGKVSTRTSGGLPAVSSVEDLLGWAEEHGLMVTRIKYEVEKGVLNEAAKEWAVTEDGMYVTPDGEQVPGLFHTPVTVNASVALS